MLGLCSYTLGTAPTQWQSILGVLLRAINNHITIIIQLLLRGGSTEPIPHLSLLHLLSSLSLRTKATRQAMLRDLVSGVGFML